MRLPIPKKIWGVPPTALIVAAILSVTLGFLLYQETRPTPTIALADFTLSTPHQEALRLDALGGQPLLINFWATWCPPCIEELPVLNKFAENPGNSSLRVIGIALDDPKAVAAFLKDTPLSYPVLLGDHGQADRLSAALGNREGVLPYTVLLDAAGHVRATHFGGMNAAELNTFVSKAP
jgi:thiol-disulfide isomerase/thioredoxin